MSDSKVYFLKHGVSRTLRDSQRQSFTFVDIGDDTGLIELDPKMHARWVAELSAINGKFGIKQITPEEVDEVKKKAHAARLRVNSLRGLNPMGEIRMQSDRLRPVQRPPVAGAVDADPVEIPESIPPPKRKGKPARLPSESLAPVPQKAERFEEPIDEPIPQ